MAYHNGSGGVARGRTVVLAGVVLFALNWLVNGSQYLGYQAGPVRFDAEVGRLARSLLDHGRFGDPFAALPTGPSAHTPPMYPAVFAIMVALFGEGRSGWLAINVLGGMSLSGWIALLPWLGVRVGLAPAAGVLGGLAAIAAGLHHFPEWDANTTALVLVVLAINGDGYILRGAFPRTASAAATGGALWALAFHLNATTLLLFTVWSMAAVWRARRSTQEARSGWRQDVPVPLFALLLPLLALGPWTYRNWQVFGQPILLRGNLGLELAVSHNDCAAPGLLENLDSGCFARTHPDLSNDEALRLREAGEPAYHARRLREAVGWIREHPRRAAELTAARIALYWLPYASTAPTYWSPGAPARRFVLIAIATVLSLAGIWQLGQRGAVIAAMLGAFPLIYYALQFEDRYRYPMLWATFLLAGHAVLCLNRPRATPMPVSVGGPPTTDRVDTGDV